jgi:hypothetical protein
MTLIVSEFCLLSKPQDAAVVEWSSYFKSLIEFKKKVTEEFSQNFVEMQTKFSW